MLVIQEGARAQAQLQGVPQYVYLDVTRSEMEGLRITNTPQEFTPAQLLYTAMPDGTITPAR